MSSDTSFGIKENRNLKSLNTFGVNCRAAYYVKLVDPEQLRQIAGNAPTDDNRMLVLGGGSNMLFVDDYPGLVLHNAIEEIEVLEENASRVRVRVGGGMNWHDFVTYCVESGWGGLENLALIPGTVGAAPIQNIGAYGVELEDRFISLRAMDLENGSFHTFSKSQCEFGYRDSFFKKYHHNYIITDVTLELSKSATPHTGYRSLKNVLEQRDIEHPSIKDVYDAVVQIRKNKLPDPDQIGNAGSFFKNPIIPERKYLALQQQFPDIPGYSIQNSMVKVPAAWLIDEAGWRGVREGPVGTYPNQALVIVNYGGASGIQIMNFASKIRRSVYDHFEIKLEPEVNIITSGDSDWLSLLEELNEY